MKVLIAGAGGVAGRALLPLLADDFDIVGLDRPGVEPVGQSDWLEADIRDWRALRHVLSGSRPFDALVDLVTTPHADIERGDRARSDFDVNVAGTWTLLNESVAVDITRIVYASTINTYGALGSGIHHEEDDLLKNKTVDVADPYGLSKRLAEQLVEYMVATRNLSGVSLRLDSLHVPAVMERRGIHILDVAEAIRLSLTCPLTGFHILNITGDPDRHHVSIEAAKATLGWVPAHRLDLRPELEDWFHKTSPPLPPL